MVYILSMWIVSAYPPCSMGEPSSTSVKKAQASFVSIILLLQQSFPLLWFDFCDVVVSAVPPSLMHRLPVGRAVTPRQGQKAVNHVPRGITALTMPQAFLLVVLQDSMQTQQEKMNALCVNEVRAIECWNCCLALQQSTFIAWTSVFRLLLWLYCCFL